LNLDDLELGAVTLIFKQEYLLFFFLFPESPHHNRTISIGAFQIKEELKEYDTTYITMLFELFY
jgi:hypothetical protein